MHLNKNRVGFAVAAVAVVLGMDARAQDKPQPPVLPVETSDVAVLPPAGPHRFFVQSLLSDTYLVDGADVIDGDSGRILGQVPVCCQGLIAVSHDADRIYAVETFYSHNNRGKREDVLSVYDGRSLGLLKEITIPGRMLAGYLPSLLDTSVDGRLAYVDGDAGMMVVELDKGRVLTTVSMPGCTSAFPSGNRDFGMVCGDGTVGNVRVPEAGDAHPVFSRPFFDAEHDPLFAESGNDRANGEAWFITFTGKVWPVKFGADGAAPQVGESWSLDAAAGLPQATTGQELAWRPGAYGKVMVYHRASHQLFVLMHQGRFWSHKDPGAEVWVLDTRSRKLVKRIALLHPASTVQVSQDEHPQLYTLSSDPHDLAIYDVDSGKLLRHRKEAGSLMFITGY